jgi:hypothetical protein
MICVFSKMIKDRVENPFQESSERVFLPWFSRERVRRRLKS